MAARIHPIGSRRSQANRRHPRFDVAARPPRRCAPPVAVDSAAVEAEARAASDLYLAAFNELPR